MDASNIGEAEFSSFSTQRDAESLDDFARFSALAESKTLADVAAQWLAAMAPRLGVIVGVQLHLLTLHGEADEVTPRRLLGRLPKLRLSPVMLDDALAQAFDRAQVIVAGAMPGQSFDASTNTTTAIAVPLVTESGVRAVIGVEASFSGRAPLSEFLTSVQIAAGWLHDALRAEAVAAAGKRFDAAASALRTVITVVESAGFAEAAQATSTDLAIRYRCDRVSVGLFHRGQLKVRAISNAAQFLANLRDIRLIEAAMNEAIDQETTILWPTPEDDDDLVLAAHAAMDRNLGGVCLFTVPMHDDRSGYYGAMVFERSRDTPFLVDELDLLEATVTVIAPILTEKHQNDRWVLVKVWQAALAQFKLLVGPRRFLRKLIIGGIFVVTGILIFGHQTLVVPASAIVEGATQRVIAASFDGFIADAPVREGDVVKKGQLLVQLDDRDLVLEKLRLTTSATQEQLELDKAIASRDRSQTAIREARIQQAESQIRLIDSQLGRSQLRAPFDGLVISGDLSQSIGAAVSRGEAMLTVAPLENYRIVLSVDEHQISSIHPGQIARLRLTALPDQIFGLELGSVEPVARYGNGATTYRVVAELTAPAAELRHGMQGVARIDIERRSLWSVWITPVMDWLRFALWSKWPN
jgi:RND family efflux transporter MFP subunit